MKKKRSNFYYVNSSFFGILPAIIFYLWLWTSVPETDVLTIRDKIDLVTNILQFIMLGALLGRVDKLHDETR